jgi:regulator of sirC expression with transglutaminase-like and TPR domain
MSERLDLTLFAHVCSSLEQHFADAALLVGQIERPSLDIARYLAELDELGAKVRKAAGEATGNPAGEDARLHRAVRYLYDSAGFRGNAEDYYDPRNSFVGEVLDRKLGIPISLSVVVLEACDRAGIPAYGVAFPSHFLVRSGSGAVIIDPFAGRRLDAGDLRTLYTRVTGDHRGPSERLLTPASKGQILLRMLANLRGIYASRDDTEHLRAVLERIQVLAPNEDLAREIQRLGGTTPWRASARPGGGGGVIN